MSPISMKLPLKFTLALAFACQACLQTTVGQESVLRALILDGQNNHKWKETTPLIKATLESTGRFACEVATAPGLAGDMASFTPKFSEFDVVVSNYNGQPWSDATNTAFVDYVRSGGGFVSVHAADNSFPAWPDYNHMIGVGGWGGRNEKDGPYVRWREGRFVQDTQPGRGGSHGKRHPFEVIVRDTTHPITRGIPATWMQAEDELYAELRGPATKMDVLATAFSSKDTNGTGEHEPILMVIEFGKGRVFHTTLGHDTKSMSGTAFQITLQRGAEWAATGKVTQPAVTAMLLSAKEAVMRDPTQLKLPLGHAKVDFSKAPNITSDKFLSIFNGKDLEGWSQKNGLATYEVVDGAVVGHTAMNSPNSFLCSEKDYADFELTFEVKVDVGLNSGVQIRSKSLADKDNGRVHGPQVEIESGVAESGYVYGEATGRGWLSPTQPATDAIKDNEWNRYIVRAVGPRIQTWINGRMIEDIYDPESYQDGFIGLQVHGVGDKGPFEVRWRDIRIHEIP
jgi:type 1 glutamine amidotransferase